MKHEKNIDINNYTLNDTFIFDIFKSNDKILKMNLLNDGNIYYGNIVNNKFKGYGILYMNNGDIIYGKWFLDKGKCKIIYNDGNIYIGHIKKYKNIYLKNKTGKLYYHNGDIYNGEWNNDVRHGSGEFYSKEKNVTIKGEWYSDFFKNKEDNNISIEDYISVCNFQLNNMYGYFDITCKNINICNDFTITIKISNNHDGNKKYLKKYINDLHKMLNKNLKNFKDIIKSLTIDEEVFDDNQIYSFILKLKLINTRKMILKELSKNKITKNYIRKYLVTKDLIKKNKIEYSDIIDLIYGNNNLILFKKIIETVQIFDNNFYYN